MSTATRSNGAVKAAKDITRSIEDWPTTHTVKHEEAIVGSLIVHRESAEVVSGVLLPEDFSDLSLGRLCVILQRLRFEGLGNDDDARLVHELAGSGLASEYCSPAAIYKFTEKACSPTSCAYHAAKITTGAAVRRVLKLVGETIEKCRAFEIDPGELCEWLAGQAVKLTRQESRGCGVETFAAVGVQMIQQLRDQLAGGMSRTILSGLPGLDARIGGMAAGELVLLGARTSMGKTTLAMQIAAHNARMQRDVFYLSLEMSGRELVQRQICGFCEISSVRVRAGEFNEWDVNNMEDALKNYASAPFHIYAPPRATLEHVAAAVRSVHSRSPLSLIVVDYLTLIASSQRKQRYEEIGDIAKGLRALGKEVGAPVLALCQLQREADDTPPKLRHLRESGDLEQDADIVLFLHREKENNMLIVAKHRNGPQGAVPLLWFGQSCRFVDKDGAPEEQKQF